MWLAVDSGNSRIKWAQVCGRRIINSGALSGASSVRGLAAAAKDCDEVVVADVAGSKRRGAIIKVLSPLPPISRGGGVCFIPPSPLRFGGVRNCYKKPHTLGIDRWMAILAAADKKKDVVIADAGTALTIDALTVGGDFVGGVIVPGAKLMRRALMTKTAMVMDAPTPLSPPLRSGYGGRDTNSAVAAGVGAAMAGAVLGFRRRVLPSAAIIISGGDAGELLPWLPRAVLYKPHLVLEGIVRWRELQK